MCRWTAFWAASSLLNANRNSTAVLKSFQNSGKFPASRMSVHTKQFYAFGPFRLDSEKRVLVRDGRPVPLTPKTAEILLVLVENAGHLVDKDELMKLVWPDAIVCTRGQRDDLRSEAKRWGIGSI
jgi:DNA-binding response OmpR family regulator